MIYLTPNHPERKFLLEDMIIGDSIQSKSVRVETPDGTLFVTILEDETGRPTEIMHLNIGRAGSPIRAWTMCVANLINLLLSSGHTLYEILEVISNIHSDKLAMSSGIPIQSGPDGLVQAFLSYAKISEDEAYESGRIASRRSFIARREAEG